MYNFFPNLKRKRKRDVELVLMNLSRKANTTAHLNLTKQMYLKLDSHLLQLIQHPFNVMNNVFFLLKAFFVLKILNFLSWLFWSCRKTIIFYDFSWKIFLEACSNLIVWLPLLFYLSGNLCNCLSPRVWRHKLWIFAFLSLVSITG